MIECVTLDSSHLFSGNPIASQHALRYRAIVKRQSWEVPSVREMEYDQYDNPAATYLVWRQNDVVYGSSRLYPTDRSYMLEEHFSQFVTRAPVPKAQTIYEGSRFCIDETLPPALRAQISRELVGGYLAFAEASGIERIVGLMYPMYWRRIFAGAGVTPHYLGDAQKLEDGMRAQAGWINTDRQSIAAVPFMNGPFRPQVSFGTIEERRVA